MHRAAKENKPVGALETVRAFNEAVNAQQWDRVAESLTEDFVFSGVTPQPVGKQGFIEAQKAWAAGAPDWRAALENLREERGVVKADTRITGTHTGNLALPGMPPISPTGKSFASTNRATATVRGDQLASLTVEPGSPGIMEQLGVQRPTS
jgi:ketosteroid isomerase-like protein